MISWDLNMILKFFSFNLVIKMSYDFKHLLVMVSKYLMKELEKEWEKEHKPRNGGYGNNRKRKYSLLLPKAYLSQIE